MVVALYYLVSIVSFVTAAPNTICVWDSTGDEWDRFNGEYAKQSTTYNGYAWYIQSKGNPNCPTSSYTKIYASQYDNDEYWQAMIVQTTDWQPLFPNCENKNIENPTLCNDNNWILFDASEKEIGSMPWQITGTTCPTLPCGRIKVTSSGDSNCNQIFTKDFSEDYVYTYGTRYLYFNPWTFKWYCSNTDGHMNCANDGSITHQIWSSASDGWTSTTIGQSFDLPVTTGSTAIFKCLDTLAPTSNPTPKPTDSPTDPTNSPTAAPTHSTTHPTMSPTRAPSFSPTDAPTLAPSTTPTSPPSIAPTLAPSLAPSITPTLAPSTTPTRNPTSPPTNAPSKTPTSPPTNAPSQRPSNAPSNAPSTPPTSAPSAVPSDAPSHVPTHAPSNAPSRAPSNAPSNAPTAPPTSAPSTVPSDAPSNAPSRAPSNAPSGAPSNAPSKTPTTPPTHAPSAAPSDAPSIAPTQAPSNVPSQAPSNAPSTTPTSPPTNAPTQSPTDRTESPTDAPTRAPSSAPTAAPTITWSLCTPNLECEYISQIIFTLDWSAVDAFGEYLSDIIWVQTRLEHIVRMELKEYVQIPNTLVVVSMPSSIVADVMVGMDDGEVMDTLLTDLRESQDMTDRIATSVTHDTQQKYKDSAFVVNSISVETTVIKPKESEERTQAGDATIVLLVIAIVAGVVLIVIGIVAAIKYLKRKKAETEDVATNIQMEVTDDVWMPGQRAYAGTGTASTIFASGITHHVVKDGYGGDETGFGWDDKAGRRQTVDIDL